jgi:hypothetical protein
MWLPSSIDLLVYSGLALVALYPFALPLFRKLPWPAVDGERWQTQSVNQLIALQAELEARKKPAAVKLCRELIWEVLGGDAK